MVAAPASRWELDIFGFDVVAGGSITGAHCHSLGQWMVSSSRTHIIVWRLLDKKARLGVLFGRKTVMVREGERESFLCDTGFPGCRYQRRTLLGLLYTC